jgi:hypothetical protein
VLKAKAKNKRRTDRITEEKFINAGFAMLADFDARSKHLPDLDFVDPIVFSEVQSIFRKYPTIDFSDAFQILSVGDHRGAGRRIHCARCALAYGYPDHAYALLSIPGTQREISRQNLIEMNRNAIAGSQAYFFARDFRACPVWRAPRTKSG